MHPGRGARRPIAAHEPHAFWQAVHPPGTFAAPPDGHRDLYPAALPDGRQIALPIRPLGDGVHAVASLIINQASFAVADMLSEALAERLEPLAIDVVVGVPTLGLTLASGVARGLGHRRFVPLGTSRKFWYADDLSVPLTSITSPAERKRLYIDPRLVPLLDGKRVAVVDDVISTGASMAAALALLRALGVRPSAVGAAMLQSDRWRARLAAAHAPAVVGVLETPLLRRGGGGGWVA